MHDTKSPTSLLSSVEALLSSSERPDPNAADVSEAAKQAHALHNDAMSHLEHAAEALRRSIALATK